MENMVESGDVWYLEVRMAREYPELRRKHSSGGPLWVLDIPANRDKLGKDRNGNVAVRQGLDPAHPTTFFTLPACFFHPAEYVSVTSVSGELGEEFTGPFWVAEEDRDLLGKEPEGQEDTKTVVVYVGALPHFKDIIAWPALDLEDATKEDVEEVAIEVVEVAPVEV